MSRLGHKYVTGEAVEIRFDRHVNRFRTCIGYPDRHVPRRTRGHRLQCIAVREAHGNRSERPPLLIISARRSIKGIHHAESSDRYFRKALKHPAPGAVDGGEEFPAVRVPGVAIKERLIEL